MSTRQAGAAREPDPFDPLRSRAKTITNFLKRVIDVYHLFETVDRILSLPPERRFAESDEIFDEFVRGSIEHGELRAASEMIGTDQLHSFLDSEIEDTQGETLEAVLHYREPQDHLIVAMHQQMFRSALEALREQDHSTQLDEHIVDSCYIALLCRFATLSESNGEFASRSRIKDIVHDIAYSNYYLRSIENETAPHPSDRLFDSLKQEAILGGAVLAYDHLDLSVNRGAELAAMPLRQFAEELSNRGIRPGYGPESVEELLSDEPASTE